MDIFSSLSAAFTKGGPIMWIMFLGQIVSFAIILERAYALYLRRSLNSKRIVKAFEADIKKGKLENVISKAQGLGRSSAIGKTLQAGAQAALDMGGKEEIQSKMDEVLLAESANIEKRIGFLAAIGNVGTLAGLFGTIIGLIGSFEGVASADPLAKANLLSQGISVAMYSTAYGLIIAMPALIMYAIYQSRANSLAEDTNQAALMAYNWLSFNYEPVQKTKSAK